MAARVEPDAWLETTCVCLCTNLTSLSVPDPILTSANGPPA